jgi:uncharacterized membrane protein (UPF0127 family)
MKCALAQAALCAALFCVACAQPAGGPRGPVDASTPAPEKRKTAHGMGMGTVVVHAEKYPLTFTVEVADDDSERQRGLMFREELAEDAGMLFLFDRMKVQSFWMKNTKIPLDMIFIDNQWTIVGIVENAEPLTLSGRRVDKKSQYVLEIGGGLSRKLGIASGQRVTFTPSPRGD